jgi:hypothetical protein
MNFVDGVDPSYWKCSTFLHQISKRCDLMSLFVFLFL